MDRNLTFDVVSREDIAVDEPECHAPEGSTCPRRQLQALPELQVFDILLSVSFQSWP